MRTQPWLNTGADFHEPHEPQCHPACPVGCRECERAIAERRSEAVGAEFEPAEPPTFWQIVRAIFSWRTA